MAKTEKALKQNATKATNPILIALDLGYGWSKLISSAGINFVFPSIATTGMPNTKMFNFDQINRSKLVVTVDNGTWMVGDQARSKTGGRTSNRTEARDRAADPISRVLFRTAVALGVPDEEGEYNVVIETGVPNEDYDKKAYVKKLEEFLSESYEIVFNLGYGKTVTKKINVTGVQIIRQPEGTVLNHNYSFNPNFEADGTLLNRIDGMAKYLGVIDIGQGTTDYALFEEAFIKDEEGTSSSTEATNMVYDKLRMKLAIRFSEEGYEYKANDTDLDVMIRTKRLWYAQEEHDVSAEVDEAVAEVADLISDEVMRSWGSEIQRLQSILITGGGAEIFYEALVDAFGRKGVKGLVKANQAQFSNVIGFYQMAVLHMIQQGMDVNVAFNEYVKPLIEMLGEAA